MTRQVIERLLPVLGELNHNQLGLVANVASQFTSPREYTHSEFLLRSGVPLITDGIAQDLGDIIRVHHAFSHEAFSKDKFEYAFERVQRLHGRNALLAPPGNRGYDIAIDEEKFSLKTEASRGVNTNSIHISKFMELGGGQWSTDPADLVGLRQQFLDHMADYDHVMTLRRLREPRADWRHYELVLIPKALLYQAAEGVLVMMENSRQTPRPGYCYVGMEGWEYDPAVRVRPSDVQLSLYFDGGGERKLQIKHLKKSLCHVLATWQFQVSA